MDKSKDTKKPEEEKKTATPTATDTKKEEKAVVAKKGGKKNAKKEGEEGEEEVVDQKKLQYLGPKLETGTLFFGVCHILATFNDTFLHVTDLSGRETYVRITGGMKVKSDREEQPPLFLNLNSNQGLIQHSHPKVDRCCKTPPEDFNIDRVTFLHNYPLPLVA